MNAQATSQGRDPSHLIGDVQGTVAAVERGDWVQAGLGMANTAMGIVGMAGNPLSGFLSAGFSWAMQHVDFLREPFDALLGNPQAIQKMSDSWLSASRQIEGIVADYRRTSVEETRGWHGRSADGYRAASKKHAAGLETLAKATKGISGAAKGAGELVASVRKTIMDLISKAVSDMVMKIIQWLSASFLTFGAAIGAAIADIVQMACNYAKKLADFLQKLAGSLKKLIDLIKSVAQIAQTAKQILQAITAMTSSNRGGSGGGGSGPRLTRGGVGLDERQLDDMHRDAGQRFTNPSGGTTNPSGSGGGGGTGGPVVSRPPTVGEGYPSGTGAPEPGRAYPGGPSGPVVSRPPTVGTGVGSGGSGGRPGGSGGGPGAGGHWEPGRWVPDGNSTSGRVPAPPSLSGTTYATGGAGGTPIVPTVPTVRPMSGDLPTTPTGGGSGGGAPAGGFGGGGGGFAGGGGGGGFAGGGGGGVGGGVGGSGGGGGGSTLQAGGSSGVLGQSGGAPGGAGAGAPGAGAAGGRPGGAGGGMGMMGAPMMGAPGQGGGDGKDHQRKVRLEGEPLIEEAPKAAKPVIGE